YAALKGRLRLQVAVALQPLLPAQVEIALAAQGQQFDAVRAILDADAKLRELITSPLMLNITLLAYRSLSSDDLTDFGSLEDRRKCLFEGYVQAMLVRRDADSAYDPLQVKRQLAWLARYMSERPDDLFH